MLQIDTLKPVYWVVFWHGLRLPSGGPVPLRTERSTRRRSGPGSGEGARQRREGPCSGCSTQPHALASLLRPQHPGGCRKAGQPRRAPSPLPRRPDWPGGSNDRSQSASSYADSAAARQRRRRCDSGDKHRQSNKNVTGNKSENKPRACSALSDRSLTTPVGRAARGTGRPRPGSAAMGTRGPRAAASGAGGSRRDRDSGEPFRDHRPPQLTHLPCEHRRDLRGRPFSLST